MMFRFGIDASLHHKNLAQSRKGFKIFFLGGFARDLMMPILQWMKVGRMATCYRIASKIRVEI